MNRPIIKKGDLTYVWQTNAKLKNLEIRETKITYHFEDHFENSPGSKTYQNAIVGRPRGAEDLEEGQEDANFYNFREICGREEVILSTSKPATIEQNQRADYVGIYTLK